MEQKSALLVLALLIYPANLVLAEDIDRPGKGQWCYDPIRPVTQSDKEVFLSEIGPAAIAAERRWGVPAPILAGMAIVESGYGLTRLALKANNVFAFKWPGSAFSRGTASFTLWCQPDWDEGKVYPAFASRADSVDFVAWRLANGRYYAKATAHYAQKVAAGVNAQISATEWLRSIAARYNYDPKIYVRHVLAVVASPLGRPGRNLWELRP